MTPEHFPRLSQLPTYVFNALHDLRDQRLNSGQGVFDFGMGNPDLPAHPTVIAALKDAVNDPDAHRYSVSAGIEPLRRTFAEFYGQRFGLNLNFQTDVVVTLGVKEGLAHLLQAMLSPGQGVLVPSPYYPIHYYGALLAGAKPILLSLPEQNENFEKKVLEQIYALGKAHHPKAIILSFPHNPTTQIVSLAFFESVIAWARENQVWVIHDFAYGDLSFEGMAAPSILQVKGAKEVALEFFSMSKSYHMAGWRVGFAAGNPELVGALKRIKSYLDYGMFAPVQKAACVALNLPKNWVTEQCALYQKRRDYLITGLDKLGWSIEKPKASMFIWARLPNAYQHLDSMAFAKLFLQKTGWVVAPGMGFGPDGEGHVRMALVQPEEKLNQALAAVGDFLKGY